MSLAAAAPLFALGEIPETKHAGRRELLARLEAVRDIGVAPLAVWAAAADSTPTALRALVKQAVLMLVEGAGEDLGPSFFEVTTAALLFHRLFNPIGALVGMVDQVQSAGASLVRAEQLESTDPQQALQHAQRATQLAAISAHCAAE